MTETDDETELETERSQGARQREGRKIEREHREKGSEIERYTETE